MTYDAKYYDKKWEKVINNLPKGGDYRYDLRYYGYEIICNTIPSGSKVFDYACGLSIIGKMLRSKGCQVSGCDFSPVAVEYSCGITNGDFRTTSDIFGDRYDVIIASYFLEHIKDPVEWVNKCLQKTDFVICSIPNNFSRNGEHIDMQWTSWESFYKLFSDYVIERIDEKDGKTLYPGINKAWCHPIIEFRRKA